MSIRWGDFPAALFFICPARWRLNLKNSNSLSPVPLSQALIESLENRRPIRPASRRIQSAELGAPVFLALPAHRRARPVLRLDPHLRRSAAIGRTSSPIRQTCSNTVGPSPVRCSLNRMARRLALPISLVRSIRVERPPNKPGEIGEKKSREPYKLDAVAGRC